MVKVLAVLNNNLIASGHKDGVISVWDLNSNKIRCSFNYANGGHSSEISVLKWIGNDLFVSGTVDGEIKVWNIIENSLKFTFDWTSSGHIDKINSLTYFGNEGLIASASQDTSIFHLSFDFNYNVMFKKLY